MSAMMRLGELGPQRARERLRSQAALVRALLDEIERLAAPADGCLVLAECVGTQLAEEVRRLGSRMLECAGMMGGEPVPSDWGAVPPSLGAEERR
jgi:hypothetical protein